MPAERRESLGVAGAAPAVVAGGATAPKGRGSISSVTAIEELAYSMSMTRGTPGPGAIASRPRLKLYTAAFAASLLYVSTGCVIGWSSSSLSRLVSGGIVAQEQASWLGPLYALGAVFGPVLAAAGLDRVGRKLTLFLVMVMFLASWIIMALSHQLYALCIARVVGGVGVGGSFAAVSVYVAEIADDETRGSLGVLSTGMVWVGILLEEAVGPLLSYHGSLVTSAYAALLFGVLFSFMPETPYFLLKMGKRPEAVTSLCWLRRQKQPFSVHREIEALEEGIAEGRKDGGGLVFSKGAWAGVLLLVVQQASCHAAVLAAAPSLLVMAGVPAGALTPLVFAVLGLLSALGAPPLVRRFGLRTALVASAVGMGVSNLVIALCLGLGLSGRGGPTNSSPFFMVTGPLLVVCNLFFSLGVGPVPWASVAELLPPHLKAEGVCFAGLLSWLLALPLLYLPLYAPVHYGLFLGSGAALLAGVLAVRLVVPSTLGLSLHDIQDVLRGRNTERPPKY